MIPPRRKSPAEMKLDALFADIGATAVADGVADALGRHVTDGPGALTAAAEVHWHRVRTLLKVRTAGDGLTAQSIVALRSWPSARVQELLAALQATHAALQDDSNARWEAEIREEVAKTYL